MRSLWLSTLAIVAMLAANAARVDACTCGAFPTLEEVARGSPIVVVGRVAAFGDLKYDDDPAWVDIDAVDAVKGSIASAPVRIWNGMAGSSCGGAFKDLGVGNVVAFAAQKVSDVPLSAREVWDVLQLHPSDHDLLLSGGCGEPLRQLKSQRDQKHWRARHLK